MEDLEARVTALLEVSKKVTDDIKEIQKAIKKIAKDAPKEKKPVAEKTKKVKEPEVKTEEKPEAKKKTKTVEKTDESSDETPAAAGGAPAKAEKRFTRMSGPTLKAFEKALGDKMSADHKKKFAEYVNDMDADKFASMSLEKHMEAYASAQTPKVLSIIQLRAHKGDLNEVSPGVYRNKAGELVTGPPEKDDEEFDDASLDGVDYLIGADTQRVHRANSDGADGPFEGYWGIGKFLEADL